MYRFLCLMAALLVLGATGCTSRTIYNVENASVSGGHGKPLTLQAVEEAITEAAESKWWKVKRIADGHLVASYTRNYLAAQVDIKFTTTAYSLTYRYSQHLGYKGGNRIHRRYNKWVVALERRINFVLKQM